MNLKTVSKLIASPRIEANIEVSKENARIYHIDHPIGETIPTLDRQ